MPESIFVFDFGSNEAAAQQARHKVEAWKQGFRLGNKMLLKFERIDSIEGGDSESAEEGARGKSGKKKSAKEKNQAKDSGRVRVLVRLNFSDHEKLSHQRWLDRIPVEEVFKPAKSQTVRSGDPEFSKTAELFDSLD
ncbi:MAG TPA: hypothetical protein VEJ45_00105 [Candidatus Acidoferrales bacterium]|nr:hypothetical protein [Candidatus Acidoferrales bacterium]